ncbi:hypothetical protein NQZ79_g867 [Umbelopsis isabellina]|nr:hypothetical protein NQZ79_g867 [Umbelopsis isabellina]
MTLFSRSRGKKSVEDPIVDRKIAARDDVQLTTPDYTSQRTLNAAPLSSNVSEEVDPETKTKVPKYQVVCLPLDMSAGRVLLVTKTDDSNVWVLPKWNLIEGNPPEATAHGIATHLAGVQGRLTSHIGEFTQLGKKKRIKAYITVYEFQTTAVLDEYQAKEARSRRWFTYVDAMQALSDKPFQQNILRRTSIAPKF